MKSTTKSILYKCLCYCVSSSRIKNWNIVATCNRCCEFMLRPAATWWVFSVLIYSLIQLEIWCSITQKRLHQGRAKTTNFIMSHTHTFCFTCHNFIVGFIRYQAVKLLQCFFLFIINWCIYNFNTFTYIIEKVWIEETLFNIFS